MLHRIILGMGLSIALMANSVCATEIIQETTADKNKAHDRIEKFNRQVFTFNQALDNGLIKPVSYLYWRYLPQPMQAGIGNFFDNLREIPTFANDLLQFKIAWAASDFSRFMINSVIGIGGLFNPANALGLDHRKGDFGQTLYQWGYKESDYLIIPVIGPSTLRDFIGLTVDTILFTPWLWLDWDVRYPLLTLDIIDLRARALRHEAVLNMVAVDDYVFFRDAYYQHRQYVFNGDQGETIEANPYEGNNKNNNDSIEELLDSEKVKSDNTVKTDSIEKNTSQDKDKHKKIVNKNSTKANTNAEGETIEDLLKDSSSKPKANK